MAPSHHNLPAWCRKTKKRLESSLQLGRFQINSFLLKEPGPGCSPGPESGCVCLLTGPTHWSATGSQLLWIMNGHIVILDGSHFTRQQAQPVISLAALSCAGLNLPTTGVLGDRWGPQWCHTVKLIIISCNFYRSKIISGLGCSWKWFIKQMTRKEKQEMENDCMTSGLEEHLEYVVWRPLIDLKL